MIRLTKNTLATFFQIAAVIFIFGYASPAIKIGEKINEDGATQPASPDSAYTKRRQLYKSEGSNAIGAYYKEKKVSGLLYPLLSIAGSFTETAISTGSNNSVLPGIKLK